MDPSTVHSLLFVVVFPVLFWIVKTLVSNVGARFGKLEAELAQHKLEDAAEFAKLNARSDEVMRRLDSIEEKVDRLLERK